jgi:hypothetical protein
MRTIGGARVGQTGRSVGWLMVGQTANCCWRQWRRMLSSTMAKKAAPLRGLDVNSFFGQTKQWQLFPIAVATQTTSRCLVSWPVWRPGSSRTQVPPYLTLRTHNKRVLGPGPSHDDGPSRCSALSAASLSAASHAHGTSRIFPLPTRCVRYFVVGYVCGKMPAGQTSVRARQVFQVFGKQSTIQPHTPSHAPTPFSRSCTRLPKLGFNPRFVLYFIIMLPVFIKCHQDQFQHLG